MFWNLFCPKCPIPDEDRRWIDRRMGWLVERFGRERLERVEVVLPTDHHFPDPYDGSEEDVEGLLRRVAGYMGLNPDRLRAGLYSEQRPALGPWGIVDRQGGTAGLYDASGPRTTIWIETSRLDDPTALVATLAHELGHAVLLGQGHITGETPDHEPLTDLLTVFMGMGVFTANSTVFESYWQGGGWHGWQIGRYGYLTAPMFGYALAVFAWLREEDAPAWDRYLRPDARSPLRAALRWFGRTGGPDLDPAGCDGMPPPGAFPTRHAPPIEPPEHPDAAD